jgi:hypothetical protein
MINVRITQICNRCETTRNLAKDGRMPEGKVNPELGGWRTLDDDFHLCPNCIRHIKENPAKA